MNSNLVIFFWTSPSGQLIIHILKKMKDSINLANLLRRETYVTVPVGNLCWKECYTKLPMKSLHPGNTTSVTSGSSASSGRPSVLLTIWRMASSNGDVICYVALVEERRSAVQKTFEQICPNAHTLSTLFANIAWYPFVMSAFIWRCKILKFQKHCATTTLLGTCTVFSLRMMLHFWKRRLLALYSQVP